MNKRFAGLCTLLIVNSVLFASSARADDATTDIPIGQVPRAVMETVKKRFPDARLQSVSRGVEDKMPFYDVFIKLREQNIWVTCDTAGTVLVIDREIAPKDLSKTVSQSLLKKYPKAIIRAVNEITEGNETSYDIALTFNKKQLIAIFQAGGQFVEEMDDDEPRPAPK